MGCHRVTLKRRATSSLEKPILTKDLILCEMPPCTVRNRLRAVFDDLANYSPERLLNLYLCTNFFFARLSAAVDASPQGRPADDSVRLGARRKASQQSHIQLNVIPSM